MRLGFAALVLAIAPGTPSQPLVEHMSFMTMFDFEPALQRGWVTHGIGDYYLTSSQPHGALNASLMAWEKYGIPSLHGDLPSASPGVVGGVFVRGTGLALGWETAIEKIAREEILPYLGPDKALRGIFLGDELCCGATAAECWRDGYGPLTAKLRALLGPKAIIYANECADIANPHLNVTEVPPGFDLISIDHYAGYMPGANGTDEVVAAKANYEVLFSKMHPHQRAVLLPGTFACSNVTWFPLEEQQKLQVQ